MDDKDFQQIENIVDKKDKKKKVDGKDKGSRNELKLCKIFTEKFGVEFSKALGSGSRWSQVNYLPEHAKKTLCGDVCPPEGFLWVIECKAGYEDDINFTNLLDGPIPRLQEFIDQSSRDADYSGRKPLICWKRNRKPWIAILRVVDLLNSDHIVIPNVSELHTINLPYHQEWMAITLDELLNKATYVSFWFSDKKAQEVLKCMNK